MKKSVLMLAVASLAVSVSVQAAPVWKPGMLTEKQIASLKADWMSKDGKKGVKFIAAVSQVSLDPKKDKAKISSFKKSGKVPVRITCSLYDLLIKNDKTTSKRTDTGTASFYLLDSEGKIALMQSAALSKMCPS